MQSILILIIIEAINEPRINSKDKHKRERSSGGWKFREVVTPHAQRERGKVTEHQIVYTTSNSASQSSYLMQQFHVP